MKRKTMAMWRNLLPVRGMDLAMLNQTAADFGNLEASVRSPRRAIEGFGDPGDLIEAGLNEGAAGFARWGYGDCIFTCWRMASFGVA